MAGDWKVEYERALMAAFVKNADAIKSGGFGYGDFRDYMRTAVIRGHLANCAVDIAQSTQPADSEWDEWVSTEDGYEELHGLDAFITCVCGEIQSEAMRWKATFSALLSAVLDEG